MALQVAGKTALVTGGGSGICLEFTKLLLASSCNVVIADLALVPEAEALIKQNSTPNDSVQGSSNFKEARVVFQKTDVTDWKQLDDAFSRALGEFGGLDIDWSSFWHPAINTSTTSPSTYATLETNVTHPIRCTQLALEIFKRQGHGVVLLITSIAAQMALLPIPLYSASKAAISSFTRSLGPLEQHSNVRVVAVAPAIVKTPIWTATRAAWVDEEKGDAWIMPQRVAEVMLAVVQEAEFGGGTVLEIGLETTRRVEGRNDPGPGANGGSRGYGLSGIMEGFARTFALVDRNFGM
ncbi:uncharacterized protein L3040_000160 [Drepanopeziza brunnea f. sp. 'multigermtubi']|uniref:uncharacterized protein n=1 Tax=Drepanopeziza brunnea f. sp. 'multigermtubi' TaxID=698441 RepID=UPI00238BCB78|nr:hypothetical protein L3040_000160 [Drepanopeziza brunnea f. sp. 'multigermtubi']